MNIRSIRWIGLGLVIAALAIDPYLETKKLFPELSQNTTNV